MKWKYIIFYESINGKGNTEVTLNNKLKSINQIRKLEDEIKKNINLPRELTITNYKKIGLAWK